MSSPVAGLPALVGLRVLIVDDNETGCHAIVSRLREWKVLADAAPNAEQALARLRAAAIGVEAYDLALLDVAMPGMDGRQLAATITSDPQLARVRLVLMGSVSVDSASDSCFVAHLTKPVRRLSLHNALMAAVTPSPMAESPALSSPTVPVTQRGTLLIVEDNPINQEVAQGIVRKLGYRSDIARNGIEALDALACRSYDAVLMDCHMPGMDGLQATLEIRRREAGLSHIPIIAMTAGAMVEERERCMAAGMDDYISKPVNDGALQAVLIRMQAGGHGPQTYGSVGSGPGPDNAATVLDAKQFEVLRQIAEGTGDPGVLVSFVEMYLEQAESQLADLREAAKRGDAPALIGAAHALKGCSATMGATGVASASAALEQAATTGEGAWADEMRRIATELGRATTELRARLPASPAQSQKSA